MVTLYDMHTIIFPRREMQKSKMAVSGGLTNSCEEEKQKAKEKRKDTLI